MKIIEKLKIAKEPYKKKRKEKRNMLKRKECEYRNQFFEECQLIGRNSK